MLYLFLAQAASSQEGNPIVGFMILGFVGWVVYLMCKPKNKGYRVNQRGETTIKPIK